MIKSDGSGSKGLTPYACLFYRSCAIEFLYQAVDLPTSDYSVFTENEGLVQIKVTIPVTTLVQITHYTSPNYTDHPQVNIH